MKYSKWIVPRGEQELPPELLAAGYPPMLAAVLARRGISGGAEAEAFLAAGADSLCPPEQMLDMDKAAARLRLAVERGETVAVYGDYDVDGITSACLVTSWLRSRGLRCLPYIPDRLEEGYGLNTAAVARRCS